MSRASFIRRSLAGTALVAISLLTICGMAAASQRSTDAEISQPTTTTEVTSTECTTTFIATSTTTSSTTLFMTTAETTTALMTTTTERIVYPTTPAIEVQPYMVEPQTEAEVQSAGDLPISEQDYILIANVISHEAGSSWISTYNRSQIVAAIMNRVSDSRFPNTVDGVVHQQGQMFDVPYYRVDYSGIGYEPIDEAIEMYFSGEYDYGSITSWWGNGVENVFYSV